MFSWTVIRIKVFWLFLLHSSRDVDSFILLQALIVRRVKVYLPKLVLIHDEDELERKLLARPPPARWGSARASRLRPLQVGAARPASSPRCRRTVAASSLHHRRIVAASSQHRRRIVAAASPTRRRRIVAASSPHRRRIVSASTPNRQRIVAASS